MLFVSIDIRFYQKYRKKQKIFLLNNNEKKWLLLRSHLNVVAFYSVCRMERFTYNK